MAKRQSIEIEGAHHGAPIPMGSKIGNIVFSSAIGGRGDDPDEQAVSMFSNIRAFMKAAGGTPDEIIRVTLLLKDAKYRENVDKEWLKMFPDENSRPARHAEVPNRLGQGLFAVELVAVLDQ